VFTIRKWITNPVCVWSEIRHAHVVDGLPTWGQQSTVTYYVAERLPYMVGVTVTIQPAYKVFVLNVNSLASLNCWPAL